MIYYSVEVLIENILKGKLNLYHYGPIELGDWGLQMSYNPLPQKSLPRSKHIKKGPVEAKWGKNGDEGLVKYI